MVMPNEPKLPEETGGGHDNYHAIANKGTTQLIDEGEVALKRLRLNEGASCL